MLCYRHDGTFTINWQHVTGAGGGRGALQKMFVLKIKVNSTSPSVPKQMFIAFLRDSVSLSLILHVLMVLYNPAAEHKV